MSDSKVTLHEQVQELENELSHCKFHSELTRNQIKGMEKAADERWIQKTSLEEQINNLKRCNANQSETINSLEKRNAEQYKIIETISKDNIVKYRYLIDDRDDLKSRLHKKTCDWERQRDTIKFSQKQHTEELELRKKLEEENKTLEEALIKHKDLLAMSKTEAAYWYDKWKQNDV